MMNEKHVEAWREQWPDGARLLDRIVDSAVAAGYTRAIVWGSVALGDYVHYQSDVDVLLVCPGSEMMRSAALLETISSANREGTDGQWSMDVLGITEQSLVSREPLCQRKLREEAPYQLHDLDLIQLRDYSVPLVGSIQDAIASRDVLEETREALEHVLGTMVPQHIEMSSGGEQPEWLLAQRRDISFVLLRCLYSLISGDIGSKGTAAAWAVDEYGVAHEHQIIGRAGDRLLGHRVSGDDLIKGAGTPEELSDLASSVEQILKSEV